MGRRRQMFEGSRAHNVSKVWGSLGGNRSCRESGSLGYGKAASPGAECVLEDSRPAASGEVRTGPDLLHSAVRTGLRVRVLAWAHAGRRRQCLAACTVRPLLTRPGFCCSWMWSQVSGRLEWEAWAGSGRVCWESVRSIP